ncbi:MAG: terpene cyclase/mutase family protein, partial [Candidatus Thermoplasmatota archaeon]|nr:terpene cyclase/mutase family protein [Candidatus Thermoplasmatota archaeon]
MNLEESIEKGCNYLISQQNEDGSICLDNDRTWDVWETANSYLALFNPEMPKNKNLEKAINFICKSMRVDGSFFVSSIYRKHDFCMETTPNCILCLYYAKKDYRKSLNFVLDKQFENGHWEIGIPDIYKYKDFPSVTGFNLNMLLKIGLHGDYTQNALNWVLNNQREDGSWGSHFIYYNSPYYPMCSIMPTLNLLGFSDSINYKKAKSF